MAGEWLVDEWFPYAATLHRRGDLEIHLRQPAKPGIHPKNRLFIPQNGLADKRSGEIVMHSAKTMKPEIRQVEARKFLDVSHFFDPNAIQVLLPKKK